MATVGISEVLLLQQRAQWLSTWVLPHEQSLRRWLEQKHMRGVDVDDVIQETYVTLSRLESVAGIRNPKAYVYQTARSLALVCLRRARVLSIQPIADIDGIVGEGIASPEQIVADRQELTQAAAALAGLPDRAGCVEAASRPTIERTSRMADADFCGSVARVALQVPGARIKIGHV